MLTIVVQRFSEDTAILAELAHLKEPPTSVGPEPAMEYVCRAVWSMLYADNTCIDSRTPQGLAKIIEVIVQVFRYFTLTVSAKKIEAMCMPSPRKSWAMTRVEAAGKIYKQGPFVTYSTGAVTKTPDMSVKIATRTCACWMRIFLETRMVKAEAIEAVLYEYTT